MYEPSTLAMILKGCFLFLGAFALPQLCGFTALRQARKAKRNYLLIPAILVAPCIYFITAQTYWEMQADALRADGQYVCGAFGAAAFFSTVAGTALHFGLSAIILLGMRFISKRSDGFGNGAPHA